MKQKIVGCYDIGSETVQLVLREGFSAEFYFQPEDGHVGRIKVGADYKFWWEVMQALTHEVMEYAFTRGRLRYTPDPDHARDNGSYLFVMDHTRFSECTCHAAMFIAQALPAVQQEWKRWHKKAKR